MNMLIAICHMILQDSELGLNNGLHGFTDRQVGQVYLC
jgi:hypothetical protein